MESRGQPTESTNESGDKKDGLSIHPVQDPGPVGEAGERPPPCSLPSSSWGQVGASSPCPHCSNHLIPSSDTGKNRRHWHCWGARGGPRITAGLPGRAGRTEGAEEARLLRPGLGLSSGKGCAQPLTTAAILWSGVGLGERRRVFSPRESQNPRTAGADRGARPTPETSRGMGAPAGLSSHLQGSGSLGGTPSLWHGHGDIATRRPSFHGARVVLDFWGDFILFSNSGGWDAWGHLWGFIGGMLACSSSP